MAPCGFICFVHCTDGARRSFVGTGLIRSASLGLSGRQLSRKLFLTADRPKAEHHVHVKKPANLLQWKDTTDRKWVP